MQLLVNTDEYSLDIVEAWKSHINDNYEFLHLTVFGEWICQKNEEIYLLSPSSNSVLVIATVPEEIEWALNDISTRAPWMLPELVVKIEEQNINREYGHIFHFVTPLFMGGSVSLDNIEQLSIEKYTNGMIQLLKQST